ncbi:unnamed protein product [Dracunculus medinensis]|uniref:Ovule protein n=1 Tax=Dracunculus medinensis TaxID=318479 RepID=A0A0N4UKT3_DRAME|nr:unnamed protein product [Dracunculus medinensis]
MSQIHPFQARAELHHECIRSNSLLPNHSTFFQQPLLSDGLPQLPMGKSGHPIISLCDDSLMSKSNRLFVASSQSKAIQSISTGHHKLSIVFYI